MKIVSLDFSRMEYHIWYSNLSDYAAPSESGMTNISLITPSSMDLVFAQFVQLCFFWGTRYAQFYSGYILFYGFSSICPITLLLVDVL